MKNTASSFDEMPNKSHPRPQLIGLLVSPYPHQRQFLIYGALSAAVGGILFFSPLAAAALLILFLAAGITWRYQEPPIFPFAIAYQWVSVVSGHFFQQVAGHLPQSSSLSGSWDRTILVSLLGLFAIALGIRVSFQLMGWSQVRGSKQSIARFDLHTLCRWVIIVYAVSWIVEISPMGITMRGAQVIYNLLYFRDVLLVFLVLLALRQREGTRLVAAGVLLAVVPRLASTMSEFKDVFLLLVVLLLTEWRPWLRTASARKRNVRLLMAVGGTAASLLFLGVLWEGRIKKSWRPLVQAGEVTGSPVTRARALVRLAKEEVSELDLMKDLESLVTRLTSGVDYFSHVLRRVPEVVPHEGGALTLRAVDNVIKPRFLFPDKPSLGSNSRLVSKYAGLAVAGEEQRTSVGLPYMAEFYVDFGLFGTVLACFFWGVFLGALCESMALICRWDALRHAATTVMVFQHAINYDGEIAYMFSGLLQSYLIFSVLILLLQERMYRRLSGRTTAWTPVTGGNGPCSGRGKDTFVRCDA